MVKSILKWPLIILKTLFLIAIIIFGILYIDTSRQFVLNAASSYFARRGIILEVKNTDLAITEIGHLLFEIPTRVKLVLINCKLERKSFFSPSSIKVDNLTLDIADNNSQKEGGFLENLPGWMKIVRIFVKDLELKQGQLNLSGKNYTLEDFQYHYDSVSESLSSKIDKTQFISINNKLRYSQYLSSRIKLKNVYGYDGDVTLSDLNQDISDYKININNGQIKIISDGFFQNFMSEINVKEAWITYEKNYFNVCGKIFPKTYKSDFSTIINLDKYIGDKNIAPEILKNLQKVIADIKIISDWKKGHEVYVTFERDNKKLGDVYAVVVDKSIKLTSNIPWINILNYKCQSVEVRTQNLRDYFCKLQGDNFSLHTELNVGKSILVNKVLFETYKGSLELEEPFLLVSNMMNGKFKFNFEDLAFFEKVLPVQGRAFGMIRFHENKWHIEAQAPRLMIDNKSLFGVKVNGSEDNLSIMSKNVRLGELLIGNCTLNKKKNDVTIKGRLNNLSDVNLSGKLENNSLKFSGKIVNSKNILNIQNGLLNIQNKIYKLIAKMSNPKPQGKVKIDINRNKFNLLFDDFSLKVFGSFFNKVVPQCKLNGRMELSSINEIFLGSGKFKIKGLVSKQNVLDLKVSNREAGLFLKGNIKNLTDNISVEALFPVVVKNDGHFINLYNNSLNIFLIGTMNLEDVFDFPDGYDLRGRIEANLKVRGNLNKPSVEGYVKGSDVLIAINDILLKNGNINLIGKANTLQVEKAEFIDSYGKKAKVTGEGKVFFSNIVPNIDAKLKLDFNNFRLFDSDSLKINIMGQGAMTGSLDNMKISGNVRVPFCELKYLNINDSEKYKDIFVENDPYLNRSENFEGDFFSYDVHMECPKIKCIGDIYSLEFLGNLDLSTYDNQSTLIGKLKLKDGKLNLFGRRMIFSRGDVEFFAEYPFDPKVNLVCKRNIGMMTALLDIKSEPGKSSTMDLYSNPSYSKDVILSYMMFEKSTKDLSIGEAAQLAHAISSLEKQGYIFSILNTLQNAGLVDTISFSTENNSTSIYKNSQTSNNAINVKAGKYLSDNIFVSVNRKDETTSFDVDISLGPNTSLKVNTLGEAGIGWKYRY